MPKRRKNIYFTDQQVERLEKKSKQENLPEAEIVRRALDAYLAWDDPTYVPHPRPQQGTAIHTRPQDAGLSGSSV
jgi:Ribbon-helix-helix protein, copG family